MKNIILSLLLVFAVGRCANTLFGQGAYVKLEAGYGFTFSSALISTNYTEDDDMYEAVYGSLGKGFNAGAAFGYMFNKNLGFELGVNYLMGSKIKGFYDSDDLVQDDDISARMVRIIPSIIIASGLEKFDPYAKAGLVVGLGSVKYNESLEIFNIDASMVTKMNGGLAIGLYTSLGVMFHLSEKIGIFGEIAMVNMSYSPTKGEVTEFIVEGDDQLEDLNTSEREYEFVEVLEYDSTPPSSKPTQEIKTKYPFGSVGPAFGIQISF